MNQNSYSTSRSILLLCSLALFSCGTLVLPDESSGAPGAADSELGQISNGLRGRSSDEATELSMVADGFGQTFSLEDCSVSNGGCSPNAECAYSNGERICTCRPGYQGDGMSCTDFCSINNGMCSPNAQCTRTSSGRDCTCKAGYWGNGLECVEDCRVNNGGCSANATCLNVGDPVNASVPLNRYCACSFMYEGDGFTCTREHLGLEGPYHWSQGNPPTILGAKLPPKNRLCWLTRMTGKFMGEGEVLALGSVSLWDNATSSWLMLPTLGGTSNQVSVGGSAMCANSSAKPVSAGWWTQGNNPRELGPADGRVCFLTKITGRFEGGGEYVSVEPRLVNGSWKWYLFGDSQQNGVGASAICYQGLIPGDEYRWKQGERWVPMTSGAACALTSVGGRFKGGGEEVRIDYQYDVPYLGGNSQQMDVHAAARCFW